MREISTPLVTDVSPTGSLTDDIIRNARERPSAVAFSRRVPAGWDDVTAVEFLAQVKLLAKGLMAEGVEAGDRVAIMSKTCFEWTLFDYAVWYAGAVSVPVYETAATEQVAWLLDDADVSAVVCETGDHAARVAATGVARQRSLPVWVIERGAVADLSAQGGAIGSDDLEARRASVSPSSVASVIYTSGTTGEPRGCVLTHGNFMFELGVALDDLRELFDTDDASTLLFLPLAHVFARIIQVGAVKAGVRLGHSPDVAHLLEHMSTFRPTFVLAVPRVFEKIFNTASQNAAADGRGRPFERAVRTAISYSRALDVGGPGVALRARHRVWDRLVYSRLRSALGAECAYAISGGAPLGERLGHFYRGIGLTVLEGYGLTETTGAVTVNRPDAVKIGTVGRPLGGTTVRVADDGELLVKGGQVFAGYRDAPEATRQVLSDEGWLHTGDLGEIDDEGFVRVTGRKKEILVTAGGKNVSPTALEDKIRAHPLVSQCLVVGDGQPFIAAVVTLDADAARTWAEQRGKNTDLRRLVGDPDLVAQVQAAVDEANGSVSQAESVRRFELLAEDWTEESGHLTPSLKLKRGVLMHDLRDVVERLYASP